MLLLGFETIGENVGEDPDEDLYEAFSGRGWIESDQLWRWFREER